MPTVNGEGTGSDRAQGWWHLGVSNPEHVFLDVPMHSCSQQPEAGHYPAPSSGRWTNSTRSTRDRNGTWP